MQRRARGLVTALLLAVALAPAAQADSIVMTKAVEPPPPNPGIDNVVSTTWQTLDLWTANQTNTLGSQINSALGGGAGGGATGFAPERAGAVQEAFDALAYAATGSTGAPAVPRWNLWSEVRGTRLDGEVNRNDLNARQVNVTVGLDHRFGDRLVIGVVGGHEDLRNTIPALTATLDGEGWSIGPYLGFRLDPRTVLEASVIYSRLDYTAGTGPAVGTFDGERLMGAVGLVQSWQLGGLLIEPSVRGYVVHEEQSAFRDSGGQAHPAREITVYGLMTGPQVSMPMALPGGARLTPAIGAYFDYKSVEQDPPPTGATSYALKDGGSARITGSLAVQTGNLTISAGGNVAALGTGDHVIWTWQGTLALRF